MKGLILSIDLGTTGLKAAILAEDGTELQRAAREYPIDTPWPGAAEQDPDLWWRALAECCETLKARSPEAFAEIQGIGICGQMHTHVHLGADGRPLRPAITWMDQRSGRLLERLEAEPGVSGQVFQETCNQAAPTYTAPNCLWVREEQPEVWRATRGLLVAKDYLKYLLTGNRVTDPTDAAGTLLFDVAKGRWSEPMLQLFRVERALLPEVAPSAAIMGVVTRKAAALTGLAAGTPVANGCSDNSAAALGCGMTGAGQATLIIGTAGVVSVCSDRPVPDPRHRLVCWNYCLPDRWISLGVTQTAGESLNWFKRSFDPGGQEAPDAGDLFQEYERRAAAVPPGAGGLVFLPYLNGERTPYWDAHARGVFFGITLETRKAHFIKAVMEGVCFALRNNLETVESLGLPVAEIRATGGGLRSRTWLASLARILRKPLHPVSLQDPGACGNAILCGTALGLHGSVREALAKAARGADPALEAAADPACERNYQTFLQLYQDLKERFRLADG
jgi:xylulokinase